MSIHERVYEDTPEAYKRSWMGRDILMKETYKGRVLERYTNSSMDDINYFALVWNPEKQQPQGICYAGTGSSSDANYANVDALPEYVEAHKNWEKKMEEESRIRKEREDAEYEKKAIRPGKYVKVVKGRKLPKGLVAKVFWYGQTHYGYSVGLEVFEGLRRVFTSASNVELADSKEVVQ